MYKECIETSNLLEISPENLDALRTRANAYCIIGDYHASLDILSQALALDRKEESRKNLMKSMLSEEQERYEEFQNRRMKPETNNEFSNKPIIDQQFIKNSKDNSVFLNYPPEKFNDSSEDQKIVKAWRLNHGLYLAGNNLLPSKRKILGNNGKLDIVTYSGEPLVYITVNDSSDRPKSFWDKLRNCYPEFSSTKESPVNDIFEADVCLLFPIAEITYTGMTNKGFKHDLNSKEGAFITDNYAEYGHFFAKKLLAGGKLILRNLANAKSVQIEQLKSHLAWALDSYHSQRENPFEDVLIFDFPIIETTNKNSLKNPKDLAKWIRHLYEDNVVEIISYEEIIPILTFLENVKYIYNSDAFINRLIPGISNKHQEITLKDWIDDIPLRNLLTWISKFPFRRGMLIDQFGISLANNQVLTFTQSPIVSKRNNHYLQLIHPETRMEEILLRNNITHKLSSIPFIEYNPTTRIDNVYLFLHNEKIEIFLDQCVAPLPVFKKAVEDAVRSFHPYRALQEVFNEFGYFLPKSVVLGNQLGEILKKQMNTSSHTLIKKTFVASSQVDIDKILECTEDYDLNYLLTPNGQVVMMNQIFDWFNEIENNEHLNLIRIDQIIPLYKILNYNLQNKIEIILENWLDSRILLTGVKSFDMDDNSKESYVRINFDEHSVLDSCSYDVFGFVFDNKDIRSENCAVNFGLFDCYGFSAFITVKDSAAKNIKGWHIIWMIVGKPSLMGTFSENQRETNIAFQKVFVDLTMCYDDFFYISLSSALSKDCIILFSTSYSPNDQPELNFKIIRWFKDVLKLKSDTAFSNICVVYPHEEMAFNVDFGDKLVAYNLFGHNLDTNDYDQFIDFNCYKNIFLTCLNAEFPVKQTKYLCTSNYGYWATAISKADKSQLAIKHIIKRRLLSLIQSYNTDVPFEAYFMREIKHNNLVKYLSILETETTFLLITELNYNVRATNWKTLHHYLKHNGALSEYQAKIIFKQIIECISFIYERGFYNTNINDRNILIFESQVKLFNLEHLMSDELNNDLAYDIQFEDDYIISYASSEMISGHNYNPEFADLWCLGILLFTMIHADVPFKIPFDTIARKLVIREEISKECSDILHRLLAKKPYLRGSFKHLLNDPWINAFPKRRVLNNLNEDIGKIMASENISNNNIIQELDELMGESQNDTRTLPLQWISSNSLSDIKLIKRGEFGPVFSATWINLLAVAHTSNKNSFNWQRLNKVALKKCTNMYENDSLKTFLREMKNHAKMNGLWGIIDLYGIAYGHKPEDLKIVLHYADKSDLNEYLKRNFVSITWKEKLSIILDIAIGLYQIHDKGIIHRDIHPGNIFLDSSCSCIGDFGLSRG
ncbi:15310_t:CDS:2 [Gigaspora margarita]|uniref:15310_t:CDS:1 n=1 Tax=Gigaspora margarita TaxID=4874 RepID=A0ABN7UHI2_GIGMA|nr:15310_t:CDS:2 [Gigaspora margarita]